MEKVFPTCNDRNEVSSEHTLRFDHEGWRTPVERLMVTSPNAVGAADIAALSTKDMRVVATMLGITKSSNRDRLAADLVVAYRTRCMLAEYGSDNADVQRLADRYKGRHLRWFCRLVRTFPGTTKYGAAASLLQWRNGCRQRGEAAVKLWSAERLLAGGGQRMLPFG